MSETDAIELSETQRERIEAIKAESADDDTPELSDGQLLEMLLDTCDAASTGVYNDDTERGAVLTALARERWFRREELLFAMSEVQNGTVELKNERPIRLLNRLEDLNEYLAQSIDSMNRRARANAQPEDDT